MKHLIIKIGTDMIDDLREIYNDPKKGIPNSNTIYLKDANELYEMLSPKRLELLKFVLNVKNKNKAIKEISRQLKRKQEAISRDASFLESRSIIKKVKEQQRTYLKPVFDSIQINL